MAAMGDMPDMSRKVMPVRSGHPYILEMRISKPKNASLRSNFAYFFQHSIEKSIPYPGPTPAFQLLFYVEYPPAPKPLGPALWV